MSTSKLAAAALAMGLLACGAGDAREVGEPAAPAGQAGTPATPPVSAAPPAAEPDALVVATRTVSAEERRRFEADLAAQVQRLAKQLDAVRELADQESGDLGDELERRTRVLEDKSSELERKLAAMKQASEAEWLGLQGETNRLVAEIQEESGRMIEMLH
jgi:hypothetical protein